MLAALLDQVVPMGYTPHYSGGEVIEAIVRSTYVPTASASRTNRLLFIAEHNKITKAFHPLRDAVIADTVRDGYRQITSLCRYSRRATNCSGDEMLDCLRSNTSLQERFYRWAGNHAEDRDTYIDLPLSSAHPALSTSVLRTVFPNIFLNIQRFNVRSTGCDDDVEIRKVYNKLYAPLETDTKLLKRRMLTIAGYPYSIDKKFQVNFTLDDVLKAADEIERHKYKTEALKDNIASSRFSAAHIKLMKRKHWSWKEGRLYVAKV